MKSSTQLSTLFFLGFVLALLAGCIQTQDPANPASPDNKLGESASYNSDNSEQPQEQLSKVQSIARELGIDKLYAAPINAKSPQEIDDFAKLNSILSILPQKALKQLLTKGAVTIRSHSLTSAFAKITFLDAAYERNTSWLISIKPSWGCIKACWEDGPISTCRGCCDDKGGNIKIKMDW